MNKGQSPQNQNQIKAHNSDRKPIRNAHQIGFWLVRYGSPVTLSIASAITTAIAAVNHGPIRVYWSIGAVSAIGLTAATNVIKEHRSSSSRQNAERTKAELATTLADIGVPLLIALGNVAASQTSQEATATIKVLLDRTVSLAQTQLGKQEEACAVRAAYYSLEGNKLKREQSHAGAGVKHPRKEFVKGRSKHDDEVVKFAHGEDVQFVRNLDHEAPEHFTDAANRVYRSFITVPVRAGSVSYGLLTADSDKAYTLTNADKGFLILVAGILATGLAHVETIKAKEQTMRTI